MTQNGLVKLAIAPFVLSLWGCDCSPDVAPGGKKDSSGTIEDSGAVDAAGMDLMSLDRANQDLVGLDLVSNPLDRAAEDTDPLQQNLPDFCAGSGSVVNFGEQGICAGDLAAQTFRFALCACEDITVSSQLTLDSFDSTQGPYGGANIGEDGNLGVNQGPLDLSHKITVRGSGFIGGGGMTFGPGSEITQNLSAYGDVAMAGGGSQASIGRNAYLNGDLGNRVSVQGDLYLPQSAAVDGTVHGTTTRQDNPQILPCPCAANQILDIAGLTAWAANNNDNAVFDAGDDGGLGLDPQLYENGGPSTLRLPCGRFYLTEMNQAGNPLDIVVTDRAVLFIDGDMTTQRFAITIEPGAELDLFVAGSVTITASASFGSADSPASVRSYIGGNITLQASAGFAGNVYAPNADIVFGAATTIHGSLMVRNVTFTASGQIHFDSAIRAAADSCVTTEDGGVVEQDAAVADTSRGDTVGVDTAGIDAGSGWECYDICDFECGFQACLIESGDPGGTCGDCTTDLDCCPPFLCASDGTCFYPGG